jgi:transcription initiation factor IIE alpha subunit
MIGTDPTRSKHGGNPESVAAYRDSCGHHQSDCDEILSILAVREDITSDEYALRTNRGVNAVSGRFTSLSKAGLIIDSGKRRPTRTGSLARAWKLAPKAGELF